MIGRQSKRLLLLLVLPVQLGAAGCGRDAEPPVLRSGTPVVLISIDTLRADHLPAYGYAGVATPALDSLRRDAILYQHAYTHTPLTLPAHTSLLTGLLPGAHGVRDNVGYPLDRGRIASGALPYLPRLLRAQGYATGAAVSAFVLQGKTGLDTDFDFYEDSVEFRTGTGLGGLQRPGGETLRLALPWLRSVATRPFFFFFHIYEPHTPYAPPPEFAARYPRSPYDGEVAAADAVVGRLLDELRQLGLYQRALIVLLSDHGEGLGDHGEDEHGVLLYDEAIHVPLLVKLPDGGQAGRTIAAPAQLSDIAPTVLGLLGLPAPAAMHGRSIVTPSDSTGAADAGAGRRRIYSETFYPRLHFGWSELSSVTDGHHHLIAGPEAELYDLAADPAERSNLVARERRLYADLRRELDAHAQPLQPPSAVDEETRSAMAALGYLGTAAPSAAASGTLPDPRSQLPALADLKTGFQLLHERRQTEAAALFQSVVERNPQMVDAWEFLGRSLERVDPERALAAYQQALRRSGGTPHIAVAAAALLFELGRLDEAAAHARLALATHASFAHGLLAQIALERKDLEVAEREARAAGAPGSDGAERIGPQVVLASVLHARGRYEEALDALRRAEAAYAARSAQDPDLLRDLELVRGRCEADLGNVAAAEAAFREEIRRFPDNLRAYADLAILLSLAGRPQDSAAALRALVETTPTPAAYAEAVKALRALRSPAAADLLRFARRRFPQSTILRELERAA